AQELRRPLLYGLAGPQSYLRAADCLPKRWLCKWNLSDVSARASPRGTRTQWSCQLAWFAPWLASWQSGVLHLLLERTHLAVVAHDLGHVFGRQFAHGGIVRLGGGIAERIDDTVLEILELGN